MGCTILLIKFVLYFAGHLIGFSGAELGDELKLKQKHFRFFTLLHVCGVWHAAKVKCVAKKESANKTFCVSAAPQQQQRQQQHLQQLHFNGLATPFWGTRQQKSFRFRGKNLICQHQKIQMLCAISGFKFVQFTFVVALWLPKQQVLTQREGREKGKKGSAKEGGSEGATSRQFVFDTR